MRKSNIIVIAILVLVSIELIWLWNYLGFSLTDPTDLIIGIIWWAVIVIVCIALVVTELRRRERLRTIFVADGMLYNCESGVVRLGVDQGSWVYVGRMKDILNALTYGSEASISHDQPRVRFKYVVRTKRFSGDGRVWRGEVVNVNGAQNTRVFSSAEELTGLLTA